MKSLVDRKVIKAIMLRAEGMSVASACREAGISIAEYNEALKKKGELVAIINDMITTMAINELKQIVEARVDITARVIELAKSGDVTVNELVTLLRYLNERIEDIRQSTSLTDTEASARAFLRGPSIQPQQSRFTANINIHITPRNQSADDIIDGSVEEVSERPLPELPRENPPES